MTEKTHAEIQFNHLNQATNELTLELNRFKASLALMLPIGLSYEMWKELHMIKGDWIV